MQCEIESLVLISIIRTNLFSLLFKHAFQNFISIFIKSIIDEFELRRNLN